MKAGKRVLPGALLVLSAALLLALPFAASALQEHTLLTEGFVSESADTGLSAEGEKYPFAVQMYEQAAAGDPNGVFSPETVPERITQEAQLQPYLKKYLEENGVLDAPDWRQVWPVTREGHLVLAQYSPALRLYVGVTVTVPDEGVMQSDVYCNAYSLAQADLAAYGIADTPQAVIPLDPSEKLSMEIGGTADALPENGGEWRLCSNAFQAVLWEDCAWSMRYDADTRGWLYRVDYATGTFVPACALEDCAHDTAACGACFDVLRPVITDLGDRLLVSWYDGQTQEGYMKSYACLVDPVSGQRSPQVLIGKGDLYSAFASDGKELLYATYDGRLRRMDMDGGWEKTLLKNEEVIRAAFGDSADPSYTYWWIRDADAQSLTLHTVRWVQDNAVAADGRELGSIGENCLLRYDIAEGTLTELQRWQSSARLDAWAVNGGKLWRVDAQNGAISCTELSGGTTESWSVPELKNALSVGLDPFVEETPILWVLTDERENGRRLAFEAAAGELRQLQMSAFKKGADGPVSYSDAGAGRLCIAYEVVQVTHTETVYGVPGSWVGDEIHYGFITAEDFLADRKNVVPFVLPELPELSE